MVGPHVSVDIFIHGFLDLATYENYLTGSLKTLILTRGRLTRRLGSPKGVTQVQRLTQVQPQRSRQKLRGSAKLV